MTLFIKSGVTPRSDFVSGEPNTAPYLPISHLIIIFLILFNVILIVTFTVTILDPGTILGKVQLIEDGATGPL